MIKTLLLVCVLLRRLDVGAAIPHGGSNSHPISMTTFSTLRPPSGLLPAIQTSKLGSEFPASLADYSEVVVDAAPSHARGQTRKAKTKGTTLLMTAGGLALLAVLGTAVADHVDRQNEGTVTSYEHDERMETARSMLGVTRIMAIVAAAMGGAQFLFYKAKNWKKSRN
ncbi:conserved hypothetical protein [Neospora caninum Liverpool]|uniref:Uncharacterized protein n=1 Tax=Neospora caninum (strain Liverpool) TaxID=572307 RepID=F0VJX8_NEOCL|nr:conserved hypothetical protein [Neospora caninum Liverpool]CBZ54040.1 conserved hypothetical protein [Neospora caninum Liverpool]CEL68045.1 TPA: hypothetical protein BN1204_038210 [Neospora caninum Liverpool]|eukprot:XP_003884071.1 conserved hypothetical protein [Neospora caninum Liverpool]